MLLHRIAVFQWWSGIGVKNASLLFEDAVNASVGGVSSNRWCPWYFVVESLGDRVLMTREVVDE